MKNEESPLLAAVRGKCITQLLLLGAIDGIQVCVFIYFLCSVLIFLGSLKFVIRRLRFCIGKGEGFPPFSPFIRS